MHRITPFEALIPEPFVVLGVRLKPLTLGHAALLMRFGGECWIDGGECGLDELLLGIAVCSSDSFDAFRSDIYDGWISKRIEELAKKVQAGDSQKEMDLFTRYIQEGTNGPKMLFQESDRKETRSHAIQSLRVQLMRFFRIPQSEVMDVPVSVALWDMATLSEMNGVAKIWTEEDDALKVKAEEFDRMWRAKNGGLNG